MFARRIAPLVFVLMAGSATSMAAAPASAQPYQPGWHHHWRHHWHHHWIRHARHQAWLASHPGY